jgi:ferritin-like protein
VEKSAKRQGMERLVSSPLARRDFAKRMMLGGVAAYGAVALGNSAELLAQGITDVDILNFALNLEYLEGEFYAVASSGQRLSELGVGITGRGRAGETTGGSKVSLDDRVGTIASQISIDETAHVNFLRAALKGDAVAKPAINLAALGVGFNSQAEFLTVAQIFEDVGVSAYGGAAPLIDSSQILAAAAGIALTEAQHAGILRLLAGDNRLQVPQVDAKAIPTFGLPGGRLFFVDGNGLSIPRTTSEVLKIVYAGGSTGGGFFPNGVNGTIARA